MFVIAINLCKSIYNDCILARPYIGDCNYKHITPLL